MNNFFLFLKEKIRKGRKFSKIILVSIIFLSFIGLVNASYLTYEHYNEFENMTCPVVTQMVDCVKVNTSIYSRIFGMPIALLGVFYYLYILLSTVYLFFGQYKNEIIKFNLGVGAFGVLFSVWLVYVQLGILYAICPYCMLSAFLTVSIFGFDIGLFFNKKTNKDYNLSNLKNEIKNFFSKGPEIIEYWKDDFSSAEGWLVINSLRGGAAGGGTRMKPGCTKEEVIELAKTMEIKFTVSGLDIGGAKSGINYDFKNEEDKKQVLARWFKHNLKFYKTVYGTGGDQNLDFVKHVDPLLSELGVLHPQEGIVRGYYSDFSEEQQNKIIDNLITGTNLLINSDSFLNSMNYVITDVSTGYGVVSVLKSFYNKNNKDLKNKKVIIEGFGCVGLATAYFLEKKGAKVVGIFDKDWYIKDEEDLNIKDLIIKKNNNQLDNLVEKYKADIDDIVYPKADVFIPAATSHTINKGKINKLLSAGVKIIVCAANNPFDSVDTEEFADSVFSVLPDFLANCGTARLFSYFMTPDCVLGENAFFDDLDKCLQKNIDKIFERNKSGKHISATMYEIAMEKINN